MLTLLIALGLLFSGTASGQRTTTFPSELEASAMLDELFKNNVAEMQKIHDAFYRLPKSPWPEHIQEVLLELINRYYMDRQLYNKYEAQTKAWCPEGECMGQMLEMATWQTDPQFAPYLAQKLNSGWLAVRGMAELGEPGFKHVLKGLDISGRKWGAVRTLEIWFDTGEPFLDKPEYREPAKRALIRMATDNGERVRDLGIGVLKYYDEPEVVSLLTSISQNDPFTLNGGFPVRAKAREALKYIQLLRSVR